VIEFSGQNWARVAAVGVLGVALGLSACGRKGPLDPPPYAAAPGTLQAAPPANAPGQDGRVGVTREGKAVAPSHTKDNRPFILDWLVE
jgi:predicted small lipoprotein YifL